MPSSSFRALGVLPGLDDGGAVCWTLDRQPFPGRGLGFLGLARGDDLAAGSIEPERELSFSFRSETSLAVRRFAPCIDGSRMLSTPGRDSFSLASTASGAARIDCRLQGVGMAACSLCSLRRMRRFHLMSCLGATFPIR